MPRGKKEKPVRKTKALTAEMVAAGLTQNERQLAEYLADPFSDGADGPTLCVRLGFDTAEYYAAVKKEIFVRYMEHLQGQVHGDLVRVAFLRSVQRGVAGGNIQSLKLYAEMNGLVKKGKDRETRDLGVEEEDAELDAMVEDYTSKMGVLASTPRLAKGAA